MACTDEPGTNHRVSLELEDTITENLLVLPGACPRSSFPSGRAPRLSRPSVHFAVSAADSVSTRRSIRESVRSSITSVLNLGQDVPGAPTRITSQAESSLNVSMPYNPPQHKLSSQWAKSRVSIQSVDFPRGESAATYSTYFADTSWGLIRRVRHMLLPWLKWLPVELAVLIFFVTPPLVFFVTATMAGDAPKNQEPFVFHPNHKTNRLIMSICAWGHFTYLALRVFATAGAKEEILVFLMWCVWVWFLVYHRRAEDIQQEVCGILSALIIAIYAVRLGMLSREVRRISRQMVSKKKRRFVDTKNNFDLDLTYISKRIIAMGFPSQYAVEAQYRNSMEEVQRFFGTRHRDSYKVYNLCIERTYTSFKVGQGNDGRCFRHEFHECRFPDHNPCPLAFLGQICRDMQDFQRADRARNVVAVHCKAGKGRTGLVIAAYLLHIKKCSTAREALELFGQRRTFNGKGVTIPSQIRYVHHYEAVVREGAMRKPMWLRLRRLEATQGLPEDCRFQIVTHEEGQIFDSKTCANESLLEGDVKVVFFHSGIKLFHFWVHTAYDPVQENKAPLVNGVGIWNSSEPAQDANGPLWVVEFKRKELDGAHKDLKAKEQKESKVPQDLVMRVSFEKPSWEQEQIGQLSRDQRRAQREEESRRRTIMMKTASSERPRNMRGSQEAEMRETQSMGVESRSLGAKLFGGAGRATAATIDSSGEDGIRSIGAKLFGPRDPAHSSVDEEEESSSIAPSMFRESSIGSDRREIRRNRASTGEVEDYDAMGNDTDEDEMLSTLHRGYLLRSSGCCEKKVKRWCEISTNGCLHIAGQQLLVVNVSECGAEDSEMVLQPVPNRPHAWKVRNPRTKTWEVLEAESEDAKHWDQAFSDALRFGVAKGNKDILFSEFFWKLNQDVDGSSITDGFEACDWRIRLFVLQSNGQVLVYSWKDQSEKVFVDFGQPLCCIEKMPFVWRTMPHTVPFQILAAGQPPRILAAREEDFDLFVAKVAQLRSHLVGEDGMDHTTGSETGYLTAEGYVTRW